MTLIAAWVRHHNKAKELYVASDSRLNGGQTWDIGTKVLDLGRGDAVIAFAGRTANAYPLMLQLQTAVKMHTKLRTRAYDLTELKGHVLRIFNDMWQKYLTYHMDRKSQILPKLVLSWLVTHGK